MSVYYYAVDLQGDHIFDNVPSELMPLVVNFKESRGIIEFDFHGTQKRFRVACRRNNFGKIFTITGEEKFLNRHKNFKELADMGMLALKPIAQFQQDIRTQKNLQTEEFIHNLTSLNTHGIQDLFALIPQSILTGNINTQIDSIRMIIDEKPNIVIKTLLKLIKYNLAMKVEFSVFERVMKPNAVVQKIHFKIRDILLSILQIFIADFDNKNIDVTLDASEKRVNVDHDSIFVSFYYLLDNAVKYCHPRTTLKIVFKEESDAFSILFIMVSLKIEQNEVEQLSVRGFRSPLATKFESAGNGIGMYRITKTLKLNNATLEVQPRINDYRRTFKGFEFEGNLFKIKLLGQQDWFKVRQLN
jgi:hypothetical protein